MDPGDKHRDNADSFGSTAAIHQGQSATALLVEPRIFHAPAVVERVVVAGDALDVGLPAGGGAVVQDDRAGHVGGDLALRLPNDLPALLGIGLARLREDQLVDLLVAVARIVAI